LRFDLRVGLLDVIIPVKDLRSWTLSTLMSYLACDHYCQNANTNSCGATLKQ